MATEAAALAREVGDRRTEARALYVSGILTSDQDVQNLADLEASIAIAREAADHWCLAHGLGGAGMACFQRGDNDEAQRLLREAVAVCEAMGDTYIVNTARQWLGRSLAGRRRATPTPWPCWRRSSKARGSPATPSACRWHCRSSERSSRCTETTELGFAYLDEAADDRPPRRATSD